MNSESGYFTACQKTEFGEISETTQGFCRRLQK